MTNKNLPATYYQTLTKVGFLILETQKNLNNDLKISKNWEKHGKNCKKILQNIPLHLEILQQPMFKTRGGSLAFEAEKKTKRKRQKFSKLGKSKFNQKIAKICDIKKLKNYSMANKNLSVTYYLTP